MKKVFLLSILLSVVLFAADFKWVSAMNGLNIRKNPDVKSAKITTIPFGERVAITESESENLFVAGEYGFWVKVKWNNHEGWAYSGFLKDFDVSSIHSFIIKNINESFKNNFSGASGYNKTAHEPLWNQKKNNVKFLQISGNLVLVEHLMPACMEPGTAKGNSVYFFNGSKWELVARKREAFLSYINDDKNPDVIFLDSCDMMAIAEIYLSDEKGYLRHSQKLDLEGDVSINIKDTDIPGKVRIQRKDYENNGEITEYIFDKSKKVFIRK